jgi:crotonobetainyl-CoA:carnitine CoA-transferase CaiB-like acyl-CoA transferase
MNAAPLAGLRVLELGHIIAGPTASLILAKLGADVIKVERPGVGDQARVSRGNQGYFLAFNSSKRSVCIDYKQGLGREAFLRLVRSADILVDNYGPGVLEAQGLGEKVLSRINPRLIQSSIKGFLSGPYESRNLLDEPAQMMSGLAFMTGPRGMPLRAGASIVDIAGAMFSVIGILAALYRRETTQAGSPMRVGLFETAVFLMSQHIAKAGISGEVPAPMPERGMGRDLGWGIYRVFETADAAHIFIGVTSDAQWESFCREFSLAELWAETELRDNAGRRAQYERLTEITARLAKGMQRKDLIAKLERANIPHAAVNTPLDLLHHAHLEARRHLTVVTAPDATRAPVPALPIEGDVMGACPTRDPPKLGAHTREILLELGFGGRELEELMHAAAPSVKESQTQ